MSEISSNSSRGPYRRESDGLDELATADWVAARIGVKRQRIYDAARQNLIPCVRIGRQLRFDRAAIEAWIDAGGQALPGGWKHSS